MLEGKITTGTKSTENLRRPTSNRKNFQSGRLGLSQTLTILAILIEEKGKRKIEATILWSLSGTLPHRWSCLWIGTSRGSRIHNIFHVSCIKKVVGQNVTVAADLPLLNEEGKLVLEPTEKYVRRPCGTTWWRNIWYVGNTCRWTTQCGRASTFYSIRHSICFRTRKIWDGRTVMFPLLNKF